MRYDIVGGAYTEPYKRANAQACINMYPHIMTKLEQHDSDDKLGYLRITPGLTEFVSVSGGTRVRGLYTQNDKCFFVVGINLYEIIGDNVTDHGAMTNFNDSDGQRVYMALNGNNQLGIFGGATAYVWDIDAATLTQITDVDFPGANGLEYMDGYGLVVRNGRVYFTELNDFTDWRGDNVFTPTYEADQAIRVLKLRGILWVFGRNTIEPYYNDGTTPFVRTPQASLDVGLLAKDSVAKYENALFFLGRSIRGAYGAYILDSQHQVAIISPGSINAQLTKHATSLDSAYGFVEQTNDSHVFYHIVIPDAGLTFSYDMLSREWHERKSEAPFPDARGSKILAQWRANCYAEYRGKYLIGDFYSGKVFEIDIDNLTEDGIPMRRERTVGVMANEQKRISVADFVIDMEVKKSNVASPKIMFSFSNDGGNNYHETQILDLPKTGGYGDKFRVRKLGSGYNLVFKMQITDAVDVCLIQASNRGSYGLV